MEIESFWNGLPGYRTPVKGSYNRIGYGYWSKKRKKYEKSGKRKAYRQIRKYGFDLSEVWSLDCTIMEWLADNVGDFFKVCGCSDDWGEYDLEGNKYDFGEHRYDSDWVNKTRLYNKTRFDSFYLHLRDFLENSELEIFDEFRDFIVPRLRMLAKIECGWPQGDDFPNFEDWTKAMNNMADEFEKGERCPTYFVEYFFNLWD